MRSIVRILMMFAPMIIRQVNRFMRDRQRTQAQRPPQQQRRQAIPPAETEYEEYDEYEEVYEEEVIQEEVVDPSYKEDDFV